MSTLLARIPLERINTEAREMNPGKTALTLIAGLLWMLGWIVGKIVAGAWLVVSWSYTAARIGFEEARRPTDDAGGG